MGESLKPGEEGPPRRSAYFVYSLSFKAASRCGMVSASGDASVIPPPLFPPFPEPIPSREERPETHLSALGVRNEPYYHKPGKKWAACAPFASIAPDSPQGCPACGCYLSFLD